MVASRGNRGTTMTRIHHAAQEHMRTSRAKSLAGVLWAPSVNWLCPTSAQLLYESQTQVVRFEAVSINETPNIVVKVSSFQNE